MGAGFAVTENFNRCGSSQTSIGSTNAPVENTQCRSAPGPLPKISARIGYATPARNVHSVGGGISENATTCFQTFSGGALMSTDEPTTNVGFEAETACSVHCTPGTNSRTTERNAGAPVCDQRRR